MILFNLTLTKTKKPDYQYFKSIYKDNSNKIKTLQIISSATQINLLFIQLNVYIFELYKNT